MFWLKFFSCVNNVAFEVFNFELCVWDILVILSEIKTQEISVDWKCRLHLEKQFNIKVLSKKLEEKFVFSENPLTIYKHYWAFSTRIIHPQYSFLVLLCSAVLSIWRLQTFCIFYQISFYHTSLYVQHC